MINILIAFILNYWFIKMNPKKKINYSFKIDNKLISKHSLSRLKNMYYKLFYTAFTKLVEGTNEPNFGLYV